MKLDAMTLGAPLPQVGGLAADAEAQGYDAWITGETGHDAFLVAAMAAEHTHRMTVGTGIAVAFARSPMTTAQQAHNLQAASGGRFLLGLGSQIRPHIERRFSMPWSKPAARMREYVQAIRAIWRAWDSGERLSFEGDFYSHTLMTPFFSPPPNDVGPAQIGVAAVGPLMTQVVGETCDVFLGHAFSTPRFVEEVTLPALRAGAERAGRDVDEVELALPVFLVAGVDEEQHGIAEQFVKSQIGFYGSTPAYRSVLEVHGLGDLQPELNRLTKEGRWADLSTVIDDDVLRTMAAVAEPGDVVGAAKAVVDRIGHLADRTALYTTAQFTGEDWDLFRDTLRG